MSEQIKYTEGYKYVLHEDYSVKTELQHDTFIYTPFVRLDSDGTLYIRKGYAWDGPSGPTADSPDSMRGSLIHDALYQLLREGKLPAEFREGADKELLRACLADGMVPLRAHIWFGAVRQFGESVMKYSYPILLAPLPYQDEYGKPV